MVRRFSLVLAFFFSALAGEESFTFPYVTVIKAWRHGHTEANRHHLLSGGGNDDPAGLTALNEEGKKQAEELGHKIVECRDLDVIYSSDLGRAVETAEAVLRAYEIHGKKVELRLSKQLREILHGKFELTEGNVRREAAVTRIQEMLAEREGDAIADPFRFWKMHPQVPKEAVVPEEIVDVEDYIERGETRPETPYQLYRRIHQELIRIARENPGKTVGVSMHGASLSSLIEALSPQRGLYLAPHYNGLEVKIGDQVILPSAVSIPNCALFHFKYDSRTDQLELTIP